MLNEKKLQEYLQTHIPITCAMGLKVELSTPQHVILSASFLNNINHKNTVFGGSLNAVATLACWSLLHINLSIIYEKHLHIVIANNETSYIAPVQDDFKAECRMIDNENWNRFVQIFHKRGKARIKLASHIYHQDKLCVDFSGMFVAIKKI